MRIIRKFIVKMYHLFTVQFSILYSFICRESNDSLPHTHIFDENFFPIFDVLEDNPNEFSFQT